MTPERFDLGDDDALEGLLRRSLDRSGEPAPFEVDVTFRVMADVRAHGPAPLGEVGLVQFGRWAAAAAAVGLALLIGAAGSAPPLPEVVADVGRATSTTAASAAQAGGTAVVLLASAARAGTALLEASRSIAAVASSYRAAAGAYTTALMVIMLAVTALVLRRDLRTIERNPEA